MAPICCHEACKGRFFLTRFSYFFAWYPFEYSCVVLDPILTPFLSIWIVFLVDLGVLAPGALPERSWKPSTTPVRFLMICCWIFRSNSMHITYNLKTFAVSCSLILFPCPCFSHVSGCEPFHVNASPWPSTGSPSTCVYWHNYISVA